MENVPLVDENDEANDIEYSDEYELTRDLTPPQTQIITKNRFRTKQTSNLLNCFQYFRHTSESNNNHQQSQEDKQQPEEKIKTKMGLTQPRNVTIGQRELRTYYPRNVIRNQKYNLLTFIPLVLFEQFRFFLNLYFLVMACTQFVPVFRVGYLYTYWGPLGFVLFVTMLREAIDDIKRAYRDKELNSQMYTLIQNGKRRKIPSSDLQVSDVIIIQKNQRIPADVVLLQTSDKSGNVIEEIASTCFIRTDQLDGETDWKLRIAVPTTHQTDVTILTTETTPSGKIHAEPPRLDIHEFNGVLSWKSDEPLSVENMLWAGTVLATGESICCVIYTGSDTRSVLNTSKPRSKVGLLDLEINTLTKLLFGALILLSVIMLALKGFHGPWWRYGVRFFLLFSYMIPISLRVNLDMGKAVYSYFMEHDKKIPGTVVRTSTIPEELGRIGYLLSDKTGNNEYLPNAVISGKLV
ncbi:unnamed protein product [Didymodactylos carnosus]|uniref:P-type phospholipid transporter n=1 Tax=Didymodactylos carnosus TaxID=1234261 RepID=A0A8S2NYS5_9BILA|nr:unnamed protein product [Didymodactylos carnosus]CAF4019267.1 unnamed protein product [Didymodactylos carnosus]